MPVPDNGTIGEGWSVQPGETQITLVPMSLKLLVQIVATLINCFANILTIIVLMRLPRITATFMLMLSFCVTDLLIVPAIVSLMLYSLLDDPNTKHILCMTSYVFAVISVNGSLFHQLLITIERCVSVAIQSHTVYFTTSRTKIIIGVFGLAIVAVYLPMIIKYYLHVSDETQMCLSVEQVFPLPIYLSLIFIPRAMIPLASMIMYCYIFNVLRRHAPFIHPTISDGYSNRNKLVTITMALNALVMFLLLSLVAIPQLISAMIGDYRKIALLSTMSNVMHLINSVINPLLYVICITSMRKVYRSVLCMWRETTQNPRIQETRSSTMPSAIT